MLHKNKTVQDIIQILFYLFCQTKVGYQAHIQIPARFTSAVLLLILFGGNPTIDNQRVKDCQTNSGAAVELRATSKQTR
jgi:hypothetical protein